MVKINDISRCVDVKHRIYSSDSADTDDGERRAEPTPCQLLRSPGVLWQDAVHVAFVELHWDSSIRVAIELINPHTASFFSVRSLKIC